MDKPGSPESSFFTVGFMKAIQQYRRKNIAVIGKCSWQCLPVIPAAVIASRSEGRVHNGEYRKIMALDP